MLAFVVGTVLEGAILPILQQLQHDHPAAAWIGPALLVAGIVLQLAATLGYSRARTTLKVAMLAQDNPAPVVNAPLTLPAGVDQQAVLAAVSAALQAAAAPKPPPQG